ncbi:TPA: hypothetical protein ACPSKY_002766 [Legionella bozemanae]|uniref:hypothetical protein n=1 Tax=Legionella bozemanae TaxID=447 RepID=UPI00104195CA|nr:hypothetical protein [Legionella bozemanae]
MPTRNKNEILLQNDRYKVSIIAVEKKIKAIAIDFGVKEDDFSPVLFDQYFAEKLNEIQEIYQSLNSLKKAHEDLILEATYRPAKIKTGKVKKHIQNQIDMINNMEKVVDTKLLEIINLYEDKSHLLFKQPAYQEQIANIINSLEKIRDFCKNNSSNTLLSEKLTHVWRSSKQSQVTSQQINIHASIVDALSRELRQLQNINMHLQNKVSDLEAKLREPSKQSGTIQATRFFKTDETKTKNVGEEYKGPSSGESSNVPK